MIFKVKNFNELTTTELYEILKLRTQIFLIEQSIVCQDMDDVDYKSTHFFIEQDKKVIAYLRVYYNDNDQNELQMGRVVTLHHKIGLGKKLMDESIAVIKENFKCKKISMHAQKQAVGFYEKCGFKVTSGEFLEEGIVHVSMELKL